MPAAVHYPDLQPPAGWTYFRQGLQIRLIPPKADPETSDVAIIVSPLVPRQPTLPPLEKLIENAIFTEARQRFEVLAQKGPQKAKANGLDGISYEVHGYPRPKFPREKRIYVMYADANCYYGVSFQAKEEAYAASAPLFWDTAGSLRPFQGRLIKSEGSPLAVLYKD